MATNGYDKLISGWERLLAAAKESEEMFQGSESLQVALEWYLQETRAAKARQQEHVIGRRQATKDLDILVAAGGEAATRLKSLVKSRLGPRDGRLPKYGITPIGKRPRKGKGSKEASSEPADPRQA